jgi:pullulanase-type alpha-1,6-glucosidase
VFALALLANVAAADHTPEPTSVTLAGSLQSELGCSGDWQPDCSTTGLVKVADGFWRATYQVPAGDWEYKVTINGSWSENYGAAGLRDGPNLRLRLAAPGLVTFTYEHTSHRVQDGVQPQSVTVAGSLQSEVGCPGDWQPDCALAMLTFDAADAVWQRVFSLPAGSFEYKAALNGSWDENYGRNASPGGANIPLSLPAAGNVKFYYDDSTNWITSNRNSVIATVPGSFQSEVGCPGDWQPDCLRSWLQDANGDGLYTFSTRAIPPGSYEAKVAHDESWSVNYGAGGVQNGPNIAFSVNAANQLVTFSYDPVSHVLEIGGDGPKGNITEARAHWLAADTLAWNVDAGSTVSLHYSAGANLAITPGGLQGADGILALTRDGVVDGALAEKFRHLAGRPVYRVAAADLAKVPQILRGQFALAATDGTGAPVDATGVQHAGVLDDLYTYAGKLGVSWAGNVPTLRAWAPTAKSVKLRLYADSHGASGQTLQMQRDNTSGTWSITGSAAWDRMYYLYEVEVYARYTGEVETFLVTDPYSLSLAMDSRRSQIVNLDDADLKPPNWDKIRKRRLAAPEDIAIYELHVRDFSMHDGTVPAPLRGTFAAFGQPNSAGAKHLRGLATAGLTHVHLLPAFDCATIPEDRRTHKTPGDLSGYAPDGEEQQAAVAAIRDEDGFNWCYDPFHYTAPEGSYATDADGPQRILEFREMVAGLDRLGLRVVMDVVYNHTSGSQGGDKSVLDKIVPGYYHRLNDAGNIETSSCCANTATEHNMMEKLMLDSLRTWATAYKVDGFRFDLMGHHTKSNIEKARDMLHALSLAKDGVDGRGIYLYGEGWNFGEVANNARFEQATQANMGTGTGVGSFNDRIRDGLRGGGPFDSGEAHIRRQGFINGLFYDPNALNSGAAGERDELLRLADWVRLGLTGTLSQYVFTDRFGRWVRGADMDYFGNPGAGYASDPQEVVNYAEAHDNETLFDINQYKLPLRTSTADRVRAVNLANSIIALSQGVPFFHAGQDILRSKSMDRNSYNSGDWFNFIDFSYQANGWGRGMPPYGDNQSSWNQIRPLLANPALADIDSKDITSAAKHLREMLRIRNSSPLFRLRTDDDVMARLEFDNTGPNQVPGLIVMSLRGNAGIEIVVLFNATTVAQEFSLDTGEPGGFVLHPVQQQSHDPIVRTATWHDGTFRVPARTTAVFVAN